MRIIVVGEQKKSHLCTPQSQGKRDIKKLEISEERGVDETERLALEEKKGVLKNYFKKHLEITKINFIFAAPTKGKHFRAIQKWNKNRRFNLQ